MNWIIPIADFTTVKEEVELPIVIEATTTLLACEESVYIKHGLL
jgi:hypothetical protein